MKKALLTLFTTALISILPITGVYAQSCTITQASSNSSFPVGGLTGQTFTACETAQLESITFYYTNSNANSLPNGINFSVSEGDFFLDNSNLGFTELASLSLGATELQSNFSAGATPVTIDLTGQNIMLTAGNTYGFVLENTGSNSTFLNLGNNVYSEGVFARYNSNSGAIEGELNDLRFNVSISNCLLPIAAISENFEAIPSSTQGAPPCWSSNATNLTTNAAFGQDGSQGLVYFVPNVPDTSYIVLPEISNISTKKISVELATGVNGSGFSDAKVVLYQSTSGDPINNTTNTALDSISLPSSSPFQTLSYDLISNPSASNQGNYLRIGIITANTNSNAYVTLDNVALEESSFLTDINENFATIPDNSPLPNGWVGHSGAPWDSGRSVGVSSEKLQTYTNENNEAIVVLPGIEGLSNKILSFSAEVEFNVDLAQLEVYVKSSQTASVENLTPIANYTLGSNAPQTITINMAAQGLTPQNGNYIVLKIKNREDESGNVNGFVRTRLDDFNTIDFVNSAPTDLILTASPIAEDAVIGTVIGTFSTTDADAGDTHTYQIIGDANIPSITVNGANLIVEGQLDAEDLNPFRFNVITTDAGGLSFQKLVEFEILDVNEAPTDIGFKIGSNSDTYDSAFAIGENNSVGQNLQRLVTQDQDTGDSHSYSLSGEDAALFTIGTDPQLPGEILLKAAAVFDFELDTLHEFIIISEDSEGETLSKEFTLSITDRNDTPTDILVLDALAADTIFVDELNAINDSIAAFITVDQDTADTHWYEFVNDFASGDNFTIDGDILRTDIVFDHETAPFYEVGIRTLDQDFEQASKNFVVMINDVNEAPTDLFFVGADPSFRASIDEGNAIGDSIATIGVNDPDINDTHTFSISGTGSEDFTVDGSTLRAAKVFDYNEETIYSLTITAEDARGLTYSEQVNVAINDVLTVGPNQETALFTFTAGSLIDEINGYRAFGTEFTGGSKPAELLPENTTDRFETADNALLFSQNRSLTVASGMVDLNQDFSLNIWFRMDGAVANGSGQVLLTNSGLFVGINDQEQLQIQGNNHTSAVITETYAQPLVPQEWYMLTLVADQATQSLELYLNGAMVLTTSTQTLNEISQWYIGSSSGQFEFFGKMDDIGYFQVALSASQISALWDSFGGNSAPTDINLTTNTIEENSAIGTTIGELSTEDIDASDMHTYSITGPDAASFTLNDGDLLSAEVFDFETKSSYSISITTTDSEGLAFTKDFVITITDVDESNNNSPSDIALTSDILVENRNIGTLVGLLSTTDPDENDTHSYTLSGVDAANFIIGVPAASETNQVGLLSNSVFDFETRDEYEVAITTNDGNGGTFTKNFFITIENQNEAPTQINLTNNAIEENEEIGTFIGYFQTNDPDFNDTHTINLSGTDATSFTAGFEFIEGPGNVYVLRSSEVFDFETKSSYTIDATSTDAGNLSITSSFTINIEDEELESNDPTDITLSNLTVEEKQPIGTLVGTLTTVDPDEGDMHIYTLGGDQGRFFTLDGSDVLTAEVFDIAERPTYEIEITSNDGNGGIFTKAFIITVVAEETTVLAIEDEIQVDFYPNPVKQVMTLKGSNTTSYKLLTLSGTVLISSQIQNGQSTIDLGGIATGTYLLILEDGSYTRTETIIKQ